MDETRVTRVWRNTRHACLAETRVYAGTDETRVTRVWRTRAHAGLVETRVQACNAGPTDVLSNQKWRRPAIGLGRPIGVEYTFIDSC